MWNLFIIKSCKIIVSYFKENLNDRNLSQFHDSDQRLHFKKTAKSE